MRHRGPRAAVLAVIAAVLAVAWPAAAQTPAPPPASPARVPTLTGEVRGGLTVGSTLTVRLDATMPGGWEGLHLVEAVVVAGDRELERLRFDIEDVQLTVGEQEIVVGTGAVASGQTLRIPGSRVVVTTGGANLTFQATAEVVRAIPAEARFVLSVTDDFGVSAAVTRRLADPPDEGLTWGTVVTLIAAALFAGGFVGNLFASRRRPPARPSIYSALERRIEATRTSGSPADPR